MLVKDRMKKDEMFGMKLQLLAGEDTNENEESSDKDEQNEEIEKKKEAKTFTQEELDSAIKDRLARAKKKWEEDVEAEKKRESDLAKLSKEEREKKILEDRILELEKKELAYKQKEMVLETKNQLAEKNLPTQFAELLVKETAEETLASINEFEKSFKAEVEKAVTERMKGVTPQGATTTGKGQKNPYSKEHFSLTEQMKLEMSNPTLAKQLRESDSK